MRGNSERLGSLPGRPIGATDIANQALRHEIVERAERFLFRCQRILVVDLIEIDMVDAQAIEAARDRIHDMSAG
jgi:hypothetical protein